MDQTANRLEEQGTNDNYSNDGMAIAGGELGDEKRQHHTHLSKLSQRPRVSYLRIRLDSDVDTKTKSCQGQDVCEHLDSSMYPRQPPE